MSRKRQQDKQAEVREQILEIARRIISTEGVPALSIRRITSEMDYSPGSIYHYFKDKQEIVSCILCEGYAKILSAIRSPTQDLSPEESIRISFKNYIHSALLWPEEYKAFMLSSEAAILAHTSVLDTGAIEKRKALQLLSHSLEQGVAMGLFEPCETEITAQSIWAAMFGLLTRLIIEREVSVDQREKLINRQIEILLKGIRL